MMFAIISLMFFRVYLVDHHKTITLLLANPTMYIAGSLNTGATNIDH